VVDVYQLDSKRGKRKIKPFLISTSPNCQGHKKKNKKKKQQASPRNCHSREKLKKPQQLNVSPCHGWGPGTETGYWVKTKEIQLKYEL